MKTSEATHLLRKLAGVSSRHWRRMKSSRRQLLADLDQCIFLITQERCQCGRGWMRGGKEQGSALCHRCWREGGE